MTNPTSNFNWQMPENTDLVTNLPADFEVFGQAVDTDFADLLGGTTGQVLSKTSNTDLDFTWTTANPGDITDVTVTSPITGGGSSGSVNVAIQDGTTAQKGAVQLENSTSSTSTTTAAVPANVKTSYDLAAAAIPKSTVTTNGDLIYGTGSAAVTRLGIGSAAQVLTVSGGVPSWATPAGGVTFVGARAGITSGNQQIANNTTTTVLFTSETFQPNFDTDNIHSTSSNTGRFTVPAGKTGYWLCIATIQFESNGNGIRQGNFFLNTDLVTKGFSATASSATDVIFSTSTVLKLAVADFVEFKVLQNSGGQLAVVADSYNNQFAFSYLGA